MASHHETNLCVLYLIHMTGHLIFLCIWLQNRDTLDSNYFDSHIGHHLGNNTIVVTHFYILRHYVLCIVWLSTSICFCVWQKNWDTFVSNFIWIDTPFVFASETELINIRFKFSSDILAAILENMILLLLISTCLNSTYFISYESTLYSSLYLKAELRYIRFRFLAVILAAILKFIIFFILIITQHYITNRKSMKSYYYFHCISYLVKVILVSRIGRNIGRHIRRHLEK